MNNAMKMLMIANRKRGEGGEKSGGERSENRSEMNMGYSGEGNEMRSARSEMGMRSGGDRSEMGMRSGGGGRSEMNYGRAEAEMGMREGGTRNEMGNEYEMRRGGGGRSDSRNMESRYDESMMTEPEMARRRYRRDDRGRFLPRNEYESDYEGRYEGGNMHYPMYPRYPMSPWSPPIPPDSEYRNREPEQRQMNEIGFMANFNEEYRGRYEYPQMNEMEHLKGETRMGHAEGAKNQKLTRDMAEEWMSGLQNEDGTHGPHWTLEQVKQVMAQKGVKADPFEFWAVLNSMYADYCKVFRKYGVGDKLDFYIDMAKAFIEDKDAGEGKVANYFHSVVKK